jgi:hypothetical protein
VRRARFGNVAAILAFLLRLVVFGRLLDVASGAAPHAPVVITNSAATVTRYPLWGAVAEPSSNVYFECDVGWFE